MRTTRRLAVADVPLFWKLLAPSIALTLVLGLVGTFAVVRYLSNEAQADVDNALSRTAASAAVAIADETDYLVETARVNSHVEGAQDAIAGRRLDALAGLLGGAVAVRDRADLFVFADGTGTGLVGLRRGAGGAVDRTEGFPWSEASVVQRALRPGTHDVGDETAEWFDRLGTKFLIVATPVTEGERILGAAVVGSAVDNVVDRVARQIGTDTALYEEDGSLLARSESAMRPRAPVPDEGDTIRRNGRDDKRAVATMYAPVRLRGGEKGVVAVRLPRETTLSALSGVGIRVAAVFLAAMLAVIAIGALIARGVLRRMRELLDAHRALAAGDLTTRAPAEGSDEFGELALGFNEMAEQLQAGYAELERRVAERTAELQRLYDEGVEAAEARSEFFAAISHELRTPLFVIAGHAELMAHPELQPDEQGWEQEFGQTIHQSALDLLTRVNDILDLAKLETKKLTLDRADVSIEELTRSLIAEMMPLARQGGLRLSVDVDPGVPLVRADPTRLRDILRNLVANAIKYTPAGGDVRVSASVKSKRLVEVAVTDTGIGIPPEAHTHLFEPFYQVPGIRAQNRQTSTGLGLALAHRLVTAHGGTMRLRSRVGEGSTFSFTIPAVVRAKRLSKLSS